MAPSSICVATMPSALAKPRQALDKSNAAQCGASSSVWCTIEAVAGSRKSRHTDACTSNPIRSLGQWARSSAARPARAATELGGVPDGKKRRVRMPVINSSRPTCTPKTAVGGLERGFELVGAHDLFGQDVFDRREGCALESHRGAPG
jgi:hypothetical protein